MMIQQTELTNLLHAMINHCETEIRAMQSVVRSSDKKTRDGLIASYGASRAWRGLASDDFLRMADFVARHTQPPEIDAVAVDPQTLPNGKGHQQ